MGGFDILYACQDVDFDQQERLNSLPSKFGVSKALKLAAVSHFFTIVCLLALWYQAELGYIFLTGIVVVAALLAYEHRLVSPDDLTRVNIAFFNVNAIISVGLLVVGAADVWLLPLLSR